MWLFFCHGKKVFPDQIFPSGYLVSSANASFLCLTPMVLGGLNSVNSFPLKIREYLLLLGTLDISFNGVLRGKVQLFFVPRNVRAFPTLVLH